MLDFGRENQLKYKDVGTLVSRPEEEVKVVLDRGGWEVRSLWSHVGSLNTFLGAFPNLIIFVLSVSNFN